MKAPQGRNAMTRILIPILVFDRAGGYRVLSELAIAGSEPVIASIFLFRFTSNGPYFPRARDSLGGPSGSASKVPGERPLRMERLL